MKKILLGTAFLLSILTFSSSAFSYSHNVATGLAVEKSFIISTLDTGVFKNKAYNGSLAFTYGLLSNLELNAVNNFSVTDGEKKYDAFTFQPRFEFASNHIAALSFIYDHSNTQSYALSPQYHFIFEPKESDFCFILNMGANLYLKEAANNNNAFAYLTPVYKISPNSFHIFLELDPAYQFKGEAKGTSLNIAPGFWLGFQDAKYQLIFSFLVNNVVNPDSQAKIELGAAFYFSITF